ncbi:hypothetical protein CHS0354_031981, partial [Potamilus streckersoni]
MKNLIVLAIAVQLVSILESRMIQEDLDNHNWIDNDRNYNSVDDSDAILAEQNLDELQDMGTLEGSHIEKRRKTFLKCEGNTCKTCALGLCLGLTHLKENDNLKVHVEWREKTIYDKTIEAKPWSKCKKVKAFGFGTTACLTLSNVRINR